MESTLSYMFSLFAFSVVQDLEACAKNETQKGKNKTMRRVVLMLFKWIICVLLQVPALVTC